MASIVSPRSGEIVNGTNPERASEYFAPAKVNLTLAVLGRRPDGYHELESWVVPVNWRDRLILNDHAGIALVVQGGSAAIPADETNLVSRAAVALAKAADRQPDVSIMLEKQIPAGAGLGGGSSDAAATLLGLNEFWQLRWPIERLAPIAAELGADVPLFLARGSAIIRGRGERVERLSESWKGWLTLVVPPYPVLTAAVYRRWSGGRAGASEERRPWRNGQTSAQELASRLFNDLEAPAFSAEPRLRALHERLDGLDGRPVRMTGSGSCLFALFDEEKEALAWSLRASERLGDGERVRVVETV